jgi:hypothetical protein
MNERRRAAIGECSDSHAVEPQCDLSAGLGTPFVIV